MGVGVLWVARILRYAWVHVADVADVAAAVQYDSHLVEDLVVLLPEHGLYRSTYVNILLPPGQMQHIRGPLSTCVSYRRVFGYF